MKKYFLISVFVFSVISAVAREACPEFISLKILDGKASGINFESANVPAVRTVLKNDILQADIQTEFSGNGTLAFDIPEAAKKIKLFGCIYDLPPRGESAFFHSILISDIRKPWWSFQRDELLRAMMLISFAPDKKSFTAQVWTCGRSGNDVWKYKRNFSCIIAADGQIFKKLDDGEKSRFGAGTGYFPVWEFSNSNGKLLIRAGAVGKYYKYRKEAESCLSMIELPVPHPRPDTLLCLNMPAKEKYLAENKKSVTKLRAFAEKAKQLRCGMTPEETAAILGTPDDYSTRASKGEKGNSHAFAAYYFLHFSNSSQKNLSVTLHFICSPDGKYRLLDIY